MRKLIKYGLYAMLLLFIVVCIGVWVLLNKVDAMARDAVAGAASDALGVETTLTNLDIGLLSGTCRIEGLNVANPPGYEAPNFLAMKSGDVALTYGSLRDQTVELPYLRLTGIELNLEQEGKGGNYQVIMDNIGKGKTDEPAPPKEGEKGFIIRELTISGATANVTTNLLGKKTTKVDLPQIKLTDIGSDTDNGAQLAKVTDMIVRAILLEIMRSGFDVLPREMIAQLTGGLEKLGPIGDINIDAINKIGAEALGGAADIAKDLTGVGKKLLDKDADNGEAIKDIGETGKKAAESAEGIVKGIGGLFGKKKEDD